MQISYNPEVQACHDFKNFDANLYFKSLFIQFRLVR